MIRSLRFVLTAVLLAGCYSLQPAGGVAPVPGSLMAFDITDLGRVALGGQMGTGIKQVEGRLISKDNNEYLVSVSSVRTIDGAEQRWTGERVLIKSEHVGNVYERRFSKGRTVALSATAVAAVTAFVLTRDLFGLGSTDPVIDTSGTGVFFRPRRP